MSDARDALAEAIEWAEQCASKVQGLPKSSGHWHILITAARAQAERGAVAEGVPREPTEAMMIAGEKKREHSINVIWRAMYDAAPRAGVATDGGTVPRYRCGHLVCPYCPVDGAQLAWDAAPRASEAKEHPLRDYDIDYTAAAPDAELIAEIDAWIYRRMQDGSATSGMALLSRCRERLAQPVDYMRDISIYAEDREAIAAAISATTGAGIIDRMTGAYIAGKVAACNAHDELARKDKALREMSKCACPFCRVTANKALSDTQEPT